MDTLTSKAIVSTGLACLATALLLRPLLSRPPKAILPSPRETLLPHLSPAQIAVLPYPPDALPSARAVPTPWGTMHVFEFGDPAGERVLLFAGMSAPCVSLTNVACRLADRGCRVLLFDYFGRGWSAAPDPAATDHDAGLYVAQALCALASSEVAWLGGFHVVGYSFGGGLAAEFAGYLGAAVRSVTLVAPGGLMRRGGDGWRTRLLYSRGWFPECVLRYFVRRRFEPSRAARPRREEDNSALAEVAEPAGGDEGRSYDDAVLMPGRPDVTVSSVVAWQLRHHVGFIPAVMSAFRYGPVHERYEEWGRLALLLAERRRDSSLPGLLGGKILLVLGSSDSVIKEEQIVPDIRKVLGEEAVEVLVLNGGHEVPITKGAEIADAIITFWRENQRAVSG